MDTPAETANFRNGDAVGPDYVCSRCKRAGCRLWRQSHTMLNCIDLMCAGCAEETEADAIKRYADFHRPTDPTIGNLVPARPTPEGGTFWGHCAGDVEWWYALPQYADAEKEMELVRRERDHFCRRHQCELSEWLELNRENNGLKKKIRESSPS